MAFERVARESGCWSDREKEREKRWRCEKDGRRGREMSFDKEREAGCVAHASEKDDEYVTTRNPRVQHPTPNAEDTP